jgi:Resolvase, N terminal domain
MTAHSASLLAYYRVSTERQGKSGLGLEAQREAVLNYLNGGRWMLAGEFTEVESGKRNDRPELEKALVACKRQKAKLIIAKLDRLGRNLAFIATLMESGVEFVAVDNPHANKLTVHILAAVAQHDCTAKSASRNAQNSLSKPNRCALPEGCVPMRLISMALLLCPGGSLNLSVRPKISRSCPLRLWRGHIRSLMLALSGWDRAGSPQWACQR